MSSEAVDVTNQHVPSKVTHTSVGDSSLCHPPSAMSTIRVDVSSRSTSLYVNEGEELVSSFNRSYNFSFFSISNPRDAHFFRPVVVAPSRGIDDVEMFYIFSSSRSGLSILHCKSIGPS